MLNKNIKAHDEEGESRRLRQLRRRTEPLETAGPA